MFNIGLEILKTNHAGLLYTVDGQTVNYGVIRIQDQQLVYYTHLAFVDIFSHRIDQTTRQSFLSKGEPWLINNNYISKIKLSDISYVLF